MNVEIKKVIDVFVSIVLIICAIQQCYGFVCAFDSHGCDSGCFTLIVTVISVRTASDINELINDKVTHVEMLIDCKSTRRLGLKLLNKAN